MLGRNLCNVPADVTHHLGFAGSDVESAESSDIHRIALLDAFLGDFEKVQKYGRDNTLGQSPLASDDPRHLYSCHSEKDYSLIKSLCLIKPRYLKDLIKRTI